MEFSTLIFILVALYMGYVGTSLNVWTWSLTVLSLILGQPTLLTIILFILSVLLTITELRKSLFSEPIRKFMLQQGLLPKISETEKTAIEAGSVWVDKEFFSGKPDFDRILSEDYRDLNPEEQAFLDGPIEEICKKTDDWKARCQKDLDPEIWDLLKKHRVFGMIIPKKYGGLEFSAMVNSAVVGKLASRSMPLSVTAMVPNSLGPAELLLHYGTEEQKDYYLPRLADGTEIPCFGLTEPLAGSDAGGIQARGDLYNDHNGELCVRLNFKKRYITLASVSTIIGLAFKCYDPENLLGKGESLGITCILLPSDTKGITLGRRHDPLGTPFFNCPINGDNVEISVNKIIGGTDGIGNGWRMLMDCLSAGRAISLPAVSTGIAKYCYRGIGAYAATRQQFGMPIGKFEGIEEAMAEIGGLTYLMEATRIYTCGGLEKGEKPSVISAMAKYHFTEMARTIINHSMDVAGGSAISMGPRNLFANSYISVPIAITVEGANILTRTMIIFGQGLIRCHPFVQDEVKALENNDANAFDKAFWGHVGFVVRNTFRAKLLSLSRGYLAKGYGSSDMKRYTQKLQWASAVFSVMADITMAGYGGALKRKERITGRLGDMASWMFLCSCIIKRYETEGRNKEHLALAKWGLEYGLKQIQDALLETVKNIDIPFIKYIFNGPGYYSLYVNPIGTGPTDKLSSEVARIMQKPGSCRDIITNGIYLPKEKEEALGRVENLFKLHHQTESIRKLIKKAQQEKHLPKKPLLEIIDQAREQNLVNEEQAENLKEYETALIDMAQVDAFDIEDFKDNIIPKATI